MIYEIPNSVYDLFEEVKESDGYCSYRIIDYTQGLDMDNIDSMIYFLDQVGIDNKYIEENEGTLVVLQHPDFEYKISISSGGLGDFFSHGFDVEIVNE